jgi:hypothetical protein
MAITTAKFTKAAGWARTDVIDQLEQAFVTLGWHGGSISGIVTGIVGVQTGGNLGITTYHTNVFQTSTSGIGTGASFNIYRPSNGLISGIYVNRPGVGYTDGEVIQISAADIGGAANGAVGIALTVKIAGNASPTGFGSTSRFFAKDNTVGGTYPWGVLRHTIQANKKYGDTYRGFQVDSSTTMRFVAGSSFHPGGVPTDLNSLGVGYTNSFRGDNNLDTYDSSSSYGGYNNLTNSSAIVYYQNYSDYITFASNNSYQLDLNLFKSTIDPKFVVFSYKHPTLSSTKLIDNTYDTFVFHNFSSTLWDLDNVFLGGFTKIIPNTSTSTPYLTFRTYLTGTYSSYGTQVTKRMAEFGYNNLDINGNYASNYVDYRVYSNSYPQTNENNSSRIYLRNQTSSRSAGGYQSQNFVSSNANFNAVIKGLALNGNLIPVPYYIPDDFVLIDFDYASPSANIQQGDTITISGSEVYTVITGSYNQTTRTRGILFCARTV